MVLCWLETVTGPPTPLVLLDCLAPHWLWLCAATQGAAKQTCPLWERLNSVTEVEGVEALRRQ